MLGFALITFLPLKKCRVYLQTSGLYVHVDDVLVYNFDRNCIDFIFFLCMTINSLWVFIFRSK